MKLEVPYLALVPLATAKDTCLFEVLWERGCFLISQLSIGLWCKELNYVSSSIYVSYLALMCVIVVDLFLLIFWESRSMYL